MNTIKSIRLRLGLTQGALADGIGCTQGNIGHYENKGQTVPPDMAKRLIRLSAQMGHRVTYEDIYGALELAQYPAITQQPVQAAGQGA